MHDGDVAVGGGELRRRSTDARLGCAEFRALLCSCRCTSCSFAAALESSHRCALAVAPVAGGARRRAVRASGVRRCERPHRRLSDRDVRAGLPLRERFEFGRDLADLLVTADASGVGHDRDRERHQRKAHVLPRRSFDAIQPRRAIDWRRTAPARRDRSAPRSSRASDSAGRAW